MKRDLLFRAVAYWQLFEASMWWRTARSRPSVLFSQHDGDDTLRDIALIRSLRELQN
jgi:hypothetical protein